MTKTNERRGEYTLKVNGEDVNLLFSMNFWYLLEKNGIKLENIEQELSPENGVMSMMNSLSILLLSAGQSYARKYKTEFDYEQEDILEWFESSIDDTILQEIIETMMSGKIFGKAINQGLRRDGGGKTTPAKKKR